MLMRSRVVSLFTIHAAHSQQDVRDTEFVTGGFSNGQRFLEMVQRQPVIALRLVNEADAK
ncbi:MAG: hypothetical protein JMDDDDMK_00239 [Acidobacteria bacterium]|nr:hypothetical protein [Acidobacteriota bacterium]